MNLIIDIDEVLRNIVDPVLYVYRERYNSESTLTRADVILYDMSPLMPEVSDVIKEFFINEENARTIFMDALPIPGAIAALNRLQKDHFVHLVTHQYTNFNKASTLEWLVKHGAQFDALSFLAEKQFVFGHVVLDDGMHNLQNYKKYGVNRDDVQIVAMDKAWNKDWDGPRVATMKEFVTFVENYERRLVGKD